MTIPKSTKGTLLLVLWFTSSNVSQGDQGINNTWAFEGDLRERITYASAIDYDETDPNRGGFWTQRLRLSGDYQPSDYFSAGFTVLSALVEGIEGSPIERNHLDLHEAVLRFGSQDSQLQAGRQELQLGSQRLVATRDGTNVRRNWDGLRLSLSPEKWQMDLFVLQLVEVEPNGILNDSSSSDRVLAGIYTTGSTSLSKLDLYYLYSKINDRLTIEGLADQERHSVGTRWFGEGPKWFWNWEAVYQFGRQGSDDISAWTLATNTGYRFAAKWSPEFLLSINAASGDSRPGDGELGTFDALYPRGSYFSELAQLGPLNFFNLNPYITVSPKENLVITVDVDLYWRLETTDGVYGPPGNIVRLPNGSTERFVNTAISAVVEWAATERFNFGLTLTHSRPEAFLQETGPADITNFAELSFEMSF